MIPSAVQQDPSKVALVSDEGEVTYGELAQLVSARKAQFSPSDRFVVLAPERVVPDLVTIYAAMEARLPLILLHGRWTDAERGRAMEKVHAHLEPDPPGEESTLAIVFTSGTTGEPKAARISRRAVLAAARASEMNLPWHDDDRWLLSLPLSHVGGLSVLTRTWIAGKAMVCPPPGAFEVSTFVDVVSRHRVTLCSIVPTMLLRLLAEPDYTPPLHLRGVLVGGAPSSVGLTREARARGIPVLRTYGMTETCAQVATDHPYELHDGDGGLPFLPGVEACVVGGVLEVRGPMLFSGYLGGPPVRPTDWHRTQDLAVLNTEGRVAVLGRADDLIVSGGEKIAPLEVERIVEAVPGVRRACVFGMPDAVWGEVVCVAIEGDASDESLLRAFESTLAAYKRPRRLSVLPSFPEFASGKVDRVAVRATASASLRPLGKGSASSS